MAYQYSRYEQETIILFNEEQKTATVETYNMKMKNKLIQMATDKPETSANYTRRWANESKR